MLEQSTNNREIERFNGYCGDGQVQGFEECDSGIDTDTCCDMETDGKQCTRIRDCCPNGEVFQCVEVRNEGKDISIWDAKWDEKTMWTGYLGYYGGCVNSGAEALTIFHEMDVRHGYRKPFVLHHVHEASCCEESSHVYTKDHWGRRNELDNGFWIFTQDESHNVGPLCPSDQDAIFPGTWDWNYVPKDTFLGRPDQIESGGAFAPLNLRAATHRLPQLSAEMVSKSYCATPFDRKTCDDCVDWSQIPEVIAIGGASERKKPGAQKDSLRLADMRWHTMDLNGQYSRNGKKDCYRGLPYWVKGMLEIAYDHHQDQWFLSYHGVGAEHLRFAECITTETVRGYQDLSACTVGAWTHLHEGQDWHNFEPDETMTIMPQWFVCSDSAGEWIPNTISIEGAPPKASYLNGEYSKRSDIEQCGKDEMPSFRRILNTNPEWLFDFVDISYDLTKGQWKLQSTDGDQVIGHAKCVTDDVIGSIGYQDLSRCIEGTWKIHHTLDDESFSDDKNFHHEPAIKIHPNFEGQHLETMDRWFDCQSANECDECLDWSRGWNSDSFCDTVSIANAQSSVLNGVYTMKEHERCVGGMPYFVKHPSLQIVYIPSESSWFVSSFEDNLRIDHAKCINSKDIRKYQNLKACNKGKWMYRDTLDGPWIEDPNMRLNFGSGQCPPMSKWFEPPRKCATRPELAQNLWRSFWKNVESRIGRRKKNDVESEAENYFNENSLDESDGINSWTSLSDHLKNNACAYGAEVCAFRESVLDACDQVKRCKRMLGETGIMNNTNNWVTMQCDVGEDGLSCDVDESGNYVVDIREKSIGSGQTEGNDFWSNHIYVALTAAISLLMLAVCVNRVRYYLRNRRNQQQTANEGNPEEHARHDDQDAVNHLSIEDVEDYVQESDTDLRAKTLNDKRRNGENQPAVDRVAHSNSVVAIALTCRE